MKQYTVLSGSPAWFLMLGGCLAAFSGLATDSAQAQEPSGIQEEADRILHGMGAYLSSADEIRLRAEISYDSVSLDGEIIEYAGTADVALSRPDRLHVSHVGDELQRRLVINGASVALHNLSKNVFARTELSPESGAADIDTALDLLFEKFGFSVPVSDLVYADPYTVLIENAEVGTLVGRHAVDGVPCHHLAFRHANIDWQIWIEDGPQPVPRKLVITYKNDPGTPRYRVRFVDWEFQPRLASQYFEFRPPEGAAEIQFLPLEQVEGQQ